MRSETRAHNTKIVAIIVAALLAFACVLCGCASNNAKSEPSEETVAQANALRIGSMKGPTSIGLASMMQSEEGDFTVVGSADELTPLLLQDELDIALVPANVAAMLYQKTEGEIRVIDVNTLGVLYGVSLDGEISSVEDLRDRTIYMTGKGAVPEYTFSALLNAAGMSFDDLNVQFRSEPTEVAALVAQDPEAVGILPQPYATAITLKNDKMNTVLDLTEEWAKLTDGSYGDLITGVTIAKASTVENMTDAIDLFLTRHADSTQVANDDPKVVAAEVVELGIIDNEQLAEKALPKCNVVCLVGDDMKKALSGYLDILFEQNPKAVGGAVPEDNFYYTAS